MTRRAAAAAISGATLMIVLTSCSSDDDGGSSNRGSGTETSPISVENVFVKPRTVNGACAIQVGSTADVNYLVSNSSSTASDQLLEITTDAAQRVETTPGTPITVPVGGTLESSTTRPSAVSTRIVGLAEQADPGKSVTLSFRFAEAGTLTVRAAIEACPAQSR